MRTLWNGFHHGLDTSAALLLLCLALLTGVVLMGVPALLCWLLCETGNRFCNTLTRRQKQPEADNQEVALGDAWDKAATDLWNIGQQYTPHIMLNSMQIARLLQFTEQWQWTEQDLCMGHVEEDAS